MNWNDRSSWIYQARQAMTEFAARDIALPKAVTDAAVIMARVADAKPVKPSPTVVREAIIRGADQDDIDRLLVADATWAKFNSEWTQAHVDTAGAVLAAIRNAEPVLMPALRKQADQHIAMLAQVAALGAVTLDTLVRSGRASDAKLLADVQVIGGELTALYRLRDAYLVHGGGRALTINAVNCSVWRDPDAAAAHARGKTPADQYVAGLAAGCPLWFPSPVEAVETATAIADKRAAAQKRKADSEFGVGHVTAFMAP